MFIKLNESKNQTASLNDTQKRTTNKTKNKLYITYFEIG